MSVLTASEQQKSVQVAQLVSEKAALEAQLQSSKNSGLPDPKKLSEQLKELESVKVL